MLTNVRAIGNSKGVLIPSAFLLSCRIEDKVDMQLQDGQIVIRPVKSMLREGWYAQAAPNSKLSVDEAAWANAKLADDSEWVW